MNPLRRPDRSTMRLRELGGIMTSRREHVRKTPTEVTGVLGWAPDLLSRWEHGNRAPSVANVGTYFGYCSPIVRAEFDYALSLAKEKEQSGHWLRPGRDDSGLSPSLRSLIAAESNAQTIQNYTPDVVPGLLQTEQYMRAIFRVVPNVPHDQIEHRIRIRLRRQGLLHQQFPPRCTYVIHECALRTIIGGPQVMHEQVLQLVLSINDRCTIRVVPESAGPYGALSQQFTLFGHEKYDPAVYTDTWTAGIFVEDPEDVATYSAFLTALDSLAMTAAQSRSWLAGLASYYDRMEAKSHARPGAHRAGLAEEQPQR